jgi:hypothetical protein
MQSKKYFCYEIYKNLAVWSFNGKISYSPCSKFDGYIKQSNKFDINDIWNSTEHQQLKDLIESDQPIPQCHRCYKEEAAGLTSRRFGAKQLYEEFYKDTNVNINGNIGQGDGSIIKENNQRYSLKQTSNDGKGNFKYTVKLNGNYTYNVSAVMSCSEFKILGMSFKNYTKMF